MQHDLGANFCVVGHPNKGKSSIVATLTEIDSVVIGPESGTTQKADAFHFKVDQKVVLTLIDTPGFQRAREVLSWLQQSAVAPHERPDRVRAFLAIEDHQQRFKDEVELLTPIMQGAGVVFVTDASSPVSSSDIAEMEILRWTGQPRMAVINPIAGEAFQQEWSQTLNQYFQWVREFDPLKAPLESRLRLLSAMAELVESEQRQAVLSLVDFLKRREIQRTDQLAEQIAHYWCEQMTRQLNVERFPNMTAAEKALQIALNEAETEQFAKWIAAFNYSQLGLRNESDWIADYADLMNLEHWSYWGLKPQQLLWVSGAAGAAAGSMVDVGTAGGSMLLGAVTGGLLGTAGGWLMTQTNPGRRLRLPGIRKHQYVGPVKHPNFPFVLMSRALSFVQQLRSRTHARRDQLALTANPSNWASSEQVALLRWAKQLQSGKWNQSSQHALETWVLSCLDATENRDIR